MSKQLFYDQFEHLHPEFLQKSIFVTLEQIMKS